MSLARHSCQRMLMLTLGLTLATPLQAAPVSPPLASQPQKPLPQFYQNFKLSREPGEALAYGIVEINGEARVISAWSRVNFVRGDLITIKQVALSDSQKGVGEVNVVGFSPVRRQGDKDDDRGKSIDTSTALHSKEWAVGDDGSTFAVVVVSGSTLHGALYLHRLEPELRYVDVTINGKPHVMRLGESLRVKASDTFKVEHVATNLRQPEEVRFQIVKKAAKRLPPQRQDGVSDYEMVFSHHAQVFAKIPFSVEAL